VTLRVTSLLTTGLSGRLSLSVGTVAALVVLDLLLVAASLFALRQNVKLRSDIAQDVALLTPPTGTILPPLVGTDLEGNLENIAYNQDERPTLVYTFSMHCGHCEDNWPAMRQLQALAPRSLRIIYVDPVVGELTPEYLASRGIGRAALLVRLYPSSALVYEARAVPQLLLVDHRGRLQWSHVGDLAFGDISQARTLIEHN
jgi:hypothetical protein